MLWPEELHEANAGGISQDIDGATPIRALASLVGEQAAPHATQELKSLCLKVVDTQPHARRRLGE
jgi:hypothetical protein